MDLAGKSLVVWLSPEAIETFLGVPPGPETETAMTSWVVAGQVVGEAGPGLWLQVKRVLMPDGTEMPLREEPVYFLRAGHDGPALRRAAGGHSADRVSRAKARGSAGATGLADRIVLLRLRLGLSQPQFAARAGIHRNSVMRYERDQARPRLSTLRRIARAADLTVEQLLDGDGRWGQEAAWAEALRLLRRVWREPSRRALVLRTLRALV